MKSYLRLALTGLLMLAFISPVLAAKQLQQQPPQTEKPQQPEKSPAHRGDGRR